MQINKDTLVFGSFSSNPSNLGCERFNKYFTQAGYNAIYKSFKVENFEIAFEGAVELGFSAVAVSMPFKRVARDYLLSLDGRAKINSSLYNEVNINTILILAKNNFIGLNTDILGIKDYLDSIDFYKRYSGIHIIGNGAYGDSVKKVCIDKRIAHLRDPNKYQPTDSVKHQHNFLVFNASPVILEGKNIINANTSTETGKQLSFYQAQKQLELYEQNFFSKE